MKTPAKPSTTTTIHLRDIVSGHYPEATLKDVAYKSILLSQIKMFSEHLNRPAVPADLNPKTIESYLDERRRSGFMPNTISSERSKLRRVHRLAVRVGIICPDWPARIRGNHDSPLRHNGLRSSLRQYFRATFKPEVLCDGKKSAIRQYEVAITSYRQFAKAMSRSGHGAGTSQIGWITERRLNRFRNWVRQTGCSSQTAKYYHRRVRTVLRHAFPDRFPNEKFGPAPKPLVRDPGGLGQFLEEVYLVHRHVSDGTAQNYRNSVRMICQFAGRNLLVGDLTNDLVAGFMAWIIERGAGVVTANGHRLQILMLWRMAYKRGLLRRLPDVGRYKQPTRIPEAWSLDQFSRILAAAAIAPGVVGKVPAAEFWTALLLTLYDTGGRIGAIMGTKPGDVDYEQGTIRLRAERQKTKQEQFFRLHPETLAALEKIRSGKRSLVFDWPTDQHSRQWKNLSKGYREIIERAGLPATSRDLFHKVRRTTATQLAKIGGEQLASAHLGHSSVNVTRRYIDTTQLDAVNVAMTIPRPTRIQSTSTARTATNEANK